MANPQLDLVKDIPGYKMILKAVLKGQIQQLVEQLSQYTDEESVILTACVTDGSLSHLGSDLGKMFLQSHENVKSQFVGFCLSNQNNEEQKDNLTCEPDKVSLSTKVVSPRQQGGTLSPKHRHEPYTIKRPGNRQTKSSERSARPTEGSSPCRKADNLEVGSEGSIKVETGYPDIIEAGAIELSDQSVRKGENFEVQSKYLNQTIATFQREADKDYSDTNNTTSIENSKAESATPESIFINACISGSQPAGKAKRKNKAKSACDSDIKLEPISESDMELEITGTEPGGSNVKVNMDYSADIILTKKGATNSQEDHTKQLQQSLELVSGQIVGEGMSPVRVHICDICRKPFPSKWELGRHRRTHTGEKPFSCEYCHKAFSDKSNMNQHIKGVHFRQPFRRDR